MTQILRILLPLPNIPPLDYEYHLDEKIETSDLVLVPFKNKEITAIVFEIDPKDAFSGQLKKVIKKHSFSLSKNFMSFIIKAKEYYLADFGQIAKMVLPVEMENKYHPLEQEIPDKFNLTDLNKAQEQALEQITSSIKPSLLFGITGSGKTEVYFHLIAREIKKGKQVLLILPEIALTQQILDRFETRFGFKSGVWHSSVTKTNKQKILKGIASGSIKIIIGARSSLFLPYKDLSLIIVDEEHDQSYKQESLTHYNARDMAVLRGYLEGFRVLLGSATPSVESYHNCMHGKYQLLHLDHRYQNVLLPTIDIIDMKQEKLPEGRWISQSLKDQVDRALTKSEQVLLFLNRKGYAPVIICKSCGHKVSCRHCSTYLVLHKIKERLECHRCGFYTKIFIKCPECKLEDSFIPCGPGIERLHEEAVELFPKAKIIAISKDNFSNINEANEILHKIEKHEVDIIIGTQIITKGYHFPKLNFVGIIDVDLGFNNCDLKSFEYTFQLLQQVSGRAGRETAGRVLLQTYQKSSKIMDYVVNNNYQDFIEYELENRSKGSMPPFSKVALVMTMAAKSDKAHSFAKELLYLAPKINDLKIWGPAPASLTKLKGKYRYNLLVICSKNIALQQYLTNWIGKIKIPWQINLKIDIDPYNLT